jgi:hypothetical protein
MGYNVLSGSVSAVSGFIGSGSFTGSFGGDGAELINVKQFELYGDTAAGKIPFYKEVNGVKALESDSSFFFNSTTDTLSISKLSASSGLNLAGIVAGTATTSSFLAIDSNNNLVLTSSSGKISALNSAAANRLITFGSNTTELDGEVNLTFDGNVLNVQSGLILKRRQISSTITASATDYFIGISASANLDIRLPPASALSSGQALIFKDENGSAGTHTILILASGSQKIDDYSSIRLESPFAAVNVYSNGSDKYFIF